MSPSFGTPRCAPAPKIAAQVPPSRASDRPQSREPAPGPNHRTAAGEACQYPTEPQAPARGPSLRPSPGWERPRYHGDPRPDPSGSGPAAIWQLRLPQQFGDPGRERTSGRRTRPPSRAQPTGKCSLETGFSRPGCKSGKRAGPPSQHAARPFFSHRTVQSPSACWELWVKVPGEDYNCATSPKGVAFWEV